MISGTDWCQFKGACPRLRDDASLPSNVLNVCLTVGWLVGVVGCVLRVPPLLFRRLYGLLLVCMCVCVVSLLVLCMFAHKRCEFFCISFLFLRNLPL